MNDELLKALMESVDPARDLSDDALDELVPHDRLMNRIMAAIGDEVPVSVPTRWRRVPTLIGASAAALVIAVVGAATLMSTSPSVVPAQTSATHAPATTAPSTTITGNGTRYGIALTSAHGHGPTKSDVVNGRYVRTVVLDGGTLSVSPAPSSMKPTQDEKTMANQIWATNQIAGYVQQVLGFGLVTITMHTSTVPVIKRLAAWVGFATVARSATSCPAQISGQILPKLPTLSSRGEAAVVIGDRRNAPAVSYVAASAPCLRLIKARLSQAMEQFSVAWTQVGPLRGSLLNVRLMVPPCGALTGSSSGGSSRSITVMVTGEVAEHQRGAYCAESPFVTETINLGPPKAPHQPPSLVKPTTKILHAPVGPLRATR